MSKKVIQIRKDALFIGSLYLIPIFIVFGVLAVDLYINVQRWHYDYLTIKAKKDIKKLVENESGFRNRDKLQEVSDENKSESSINSVDNEGTRNRSLFSSFSKVLNTIGFSTKSEVQNQMQEEEKNAQKEEDIEYRLQAMMAEIEALKVEKVKLENLQNLTRLGYQLGLVSPKPEQVVRITYSKEERDKLIQTASSDLLFPQKPKKTEPFSSEIKYAEEEKSVKQKIINLINKVANSIQDRVLNEITTPVSAESKNNITEETNGGNVPKTDKSEMNLQPDKNDGEIDIDSLTEFLIEKL